MAPSFGNFESNEAQAHARVGSNARPSPQEYVYPLTCLVTPDVDDLMMASVGRRAIRQGDPIRDHLERPPDVGLR
jgi:hypothetical protein